MPELDIAIAEYKTSFRPGQTIRGSVRWTLPEDPESVVVSLFWRTEGKGTQDVGVIDTVKFDHPGSLGQRDFTFILPPAPFSFSGKLISIIWAIEATAYPSEQTTRQEITVSPTGKEVAIE
ncbi:MAG: hypothetical protein JXN61_00690 [Sedimentisphaerales bacterium]|nr:hypothetical protein [Sedimentisphaerales bacterium]